MSSLLVYYRLKPSGTMYMLSIFTLYLFREHEYVRHGTCMRSKWHEYDFFSTVLKLFNTTIKPFSIALSKGGVQPSLNEINVSIK